jgi:hypothetical protein
MQLCPYKQDVIKNYNISLLFLKNFEINYNKSVKKFKILMKNNSSSNSSVKKFLSRKAFLTGIFSIPVFNNNYLSINIKNDDI